MKEDEEEFGWTKMNKRSLTVSLAMQLAAILCFGFPKKGYLEFKCEDVTDRFAVIKTRIGSIIARCLSGRPQGSPLSCLISNLVIRFKHIAMRVDRRRTESSTNAEAPTYELAPVTMSTHYWEEDVIFVSQGFSDDNNRYMGADQGLEKALDLALLVYKRSGQC